MVQGYAGAGQIEKLGINHTDEEIDRTIEAAGKALQQVAEYLQKR